MHFPSRPADTPRRLSAKGMQLPLCLVSLTLIGSLAVIAPPAFASTDSASGTSEIYSFNQDLNTFLESLFARIRALFASGYAADGSGQGQTTESQPEVGSQPEAGNETLTAVATVETPDQHVPEPLTVLGTASALGAGLLLRKVYLDQTTLVPAKNSELS